MNIAPELEGAEKVARNLQLEGVVSFEDADIFWLLFGAILVFLMQAGFALLEVGSVRAKNTKNILIKNLLDASYGAIVWWLVGFAVAFGAERDGLEEFIGGTLYALSWNFGDRPTANTYASWLFQWAFAAAATTIVSGTVAERVTFTAYITYATVLTAFVYPCVVHSVWNADGWATAFRENDLLNDCGVIDFAGSGVVHMTGGVAALVAAIFIGPRKGRFAADGTPIEIPGQSAVLRNFGTFILWFGWYGFNGVSTLYIVGFSAVAAKTMVTTTIGAAAGALTTVIIGKINKGYVDMDLVGNGVLAGLVSITGPCSTCEPYGAFAIGIIGGFIYYYSSELLLWLKIDDVVNAIPVHGFCGAWGVIAANSFATNFNYEDAYYSDRAMKCSGFLYNGGEAQAVSGALLLVCFILAWVGGSMAIVFGILSYFGLARVDEEAEEMGLDAAEHGGFFLDVLSKSGPVYASKAAKGETKTAA